MSSFNLYGTIPSFILCSIYIHSHSFYFNLKLFCVNYNNYSYTMKTIALVPLRFFFFFEFRPLQYKQNKKAVKFDSTCKVHGWN